jgi:hypothetical protein
LAVVVMLAHQMVAIQLAAIKMAMPSVLKALEGGGVGVRLEGSWADGIADSTGEGSMAGISRAANAARAGDDATRSGDSPSVGGIGMSGGGEAGTPSHSDGGVEGGGTDVIVRVVGDVVAC